MVKMEDLTKYFIVYCKIGKIDKAKEMCEKGKINLCELNTDFVTHIFTKDNKKAAIFLYNYMSEMNQIQLLLNNLLRFSIYEKVEYLFKLGIRKEIDFNMKNIEEFQITEDFRWINQNTIKKYGKDIKEQMIEKYGELEREYAKIKELIIELGLNNPIIMSEIYDPISLMKNCLIYLW